MAQFDLKGSKRKDKDIEKNKEKKEKQEKVKKVSKAPALPKMAKPQRAKSIPPFVTLDIGSREVKVMVASYRGKEIAVKQVASSALPEGAVHDGKIIEFDQVLNCISSIMAMNKIKVTGAVVTIGSSEVVQREIIVPKVPNNDLKGLVVYEVGKFLPIDPASYSIQYDVLEEFESDGGALQLKLNVSAMPKEMAKRYLDLVLKLSLKPIALDVHSNSVAKLVSAEAKFGSPLASGSTIVIDMGYAHFNAMLFNNGRLLFNRILDVGASRLDEIIMNATEVSLDEADGLKKYNLSRLSAHELYAAHVSGGGYGNSSNREEAVTQEVMSAFESWVSAVDGLVKYYLSRSEENTVDAIYLYAGSSNIRCIDSLLENTLKIKTKKLSSLSCLTGALDNDSEGIPKYINNLGATIRF